MATPAPTPAPSSPATPHLDVGGLLGGVAHGFWAAVTASPLTIALAALVVLVLLVRVVQAVAYPRIGRDPVRRYSRADKAAILARAGGRCEHHGWLTGRCRETEKLEADHIVPWSRSGRTTVANGQALCRRHNRAKGAVIPFAWQRRALAKRRARY